MRQLGTLTLRDLRIGDRMHNVALTTLALAIILSACGGGGDGGTQPPPQTVFTALTVSPANPALVEGDTLQLSATPRDQNGAAMAGLPPASFALTTGTSVSVSATGRVVALDPGGSTVTASLTSGGTTRTATSTPNVSALGNTARSEEHTSELQSPCNI